MAIQKSNTAVETHILPLQTMQGLVFFNKVFCFINIIFLQN